MKTEEEQTWSSSSTEINLTIKRVCVCLISTKKWHCFKDRFPRLRIVCQYRVTLRRSKWSVDSPNGDGSWSVVLVKIWDGVVKGLMMCPEIPVSDSQFSHHQFTYLLRVLNQIRTLTNEDLYRKLCSTIKIDPFIYIYLCGHSLRLIRLHFFSREILTRNLLIILKLSSNHQIFSFIKSDSSGLLLQKLESRTTREVSQRPMKWLSQYVVYCYKVSCYLTYIWRICCRQDILILPRLF